MNPNLQKLKDKIYGAKNKVDVENNIYLIHHTLMKEYGWIPLEEFLSLPMQTVNNLLEQINKERKAESKAMKAKKGKRGM